MDRMFEIGAPDQANGLFERFVAARSIHDDGTESEDESVHMASVSTTGTYSITTSASSSYYTSSVSSVGSEKLNAVDGIRSAAYLTTRDNSPPRQQIARRHHHRPRRVGPGNERPEGAEKTRRPKKKLSGDGRRTPLMRKLCGEKASDEESEAYDAPSLLNGFTDVGSFPSRSTQALSPSTTQDGVPSGGTADEMMRGISEMDLESFLGGGGGGGLMDMPAISPAEIGDSMIPPEHILSPPQLPYEGQIPQYNTSNEGFIIDGDEGDDGQVGSLFTVLSEDETALFSYGGRRCIPNPFKGRKGMGKLAPGPERLRQSAADYLNPSMHEGASASSASRQGDCSSSSLSLSQQPSDKSPPTANNSVLVSPDPNHVTESSRGASKDKSDGSAKQKLSTNGSESGKKKNPLLLFYQNDCDEADADEGSQNHHDDTVKPQDSLLPQQQRSLVDSEDIARAAISPFVGKLLPRKIADGTGHSIKGKRSRIVDFTYSNKVFEDAFKTENPQWLGHHNGNCFIPCELSGIPGCYPCYSNGGSPNATARRLESIRKEPYTVKELVAASGSITSMASPKSGKESSSSEAGPKQSILASISSPAALATGGDPMERAEYSGHSHSYGSSFAASYRSHTFLPLRPFPPRFCAIPSICTWPSAEKNLSTFTPCVSPVPAYSPSPVTARNASPSPSTSAIAATNSLGITLVSNHPHLISPDSHQCQQNPSTPGTANSNLLSSHTGSPKHVSSVVDIEASTAAAAALHLRHQQGPQYRGIEGALSSPSPPEPFNATAIQPTETSIFNGRLHSMSSGIVDNPFGDAPDRPVGPVASISRVSASTPSGSSLLLTNSSKEASPSPLVATQALPDAYMFSPISFPTPSDMSQEKTDSNNNVAAAPQHALTLPSALYIKSEARPTSTVSFCTRVTVVTSTAVAAILTRDAPPAARTRSFRLGETAAQPVPQTRSPAIEASVAKDSGTDETGPEVAPALGSSLAPIRGAPYSPLLKHEAPKSPRPSPSLLPNTASLPALRRGSANTQSPLLNNQDRPNESADAVKDRAPGSLSPPTAPTLAGSGDVSSKALATGIDDGFAAFAYAHDLQLGPTLRPYFINRLLAQYATEEEEDYMAMLEEKMESPPLKPSPPVTPEQEVEKTEDDSAPHLSISSIPPPPAHLVSLVRVVDCETPPPPKQSSTESEWDRNISASLSGLMAEVNKREGRGSGLLLSPNAIRGHREHSEATTTASARTVDRSPTKAGRHHMRNDSSIATVPLGPYSPTGSDRAPRTVNLLFSSSSNKSSMSLFSPLQRRNDDEVAALADTNTFMYADRGTALSVAGSGYATTKEAEGSDRDRRDADCSRNAFSSSHLLAAFNGSMGTFSASEKFLTTDDAGKAVQSDYSNSAKTDGTVPSGPATVEVESLLGPRIPIDIHDRSTPTHYAQMSSMQFYGSASSRRASPSAFCATPIVGQLSKVDSHSQLLVLGSTIGRGICGSPSRGSTPVVTLFAQSPFVHPSAAGSSVSAISNMDLRPHMTTSPATTSIILLDNPHNNTSAAHSGRRLSIKKDMHPNKANFLARIAVEREEEASRDRAAKESCADSKLGSLIARLQSPYGRRNSDVNSTAMFDRCHSGLASQSNNLHKFDLSGASAIPIDVYGAGPLDPPMHKSSSGVRPVSPLLHSAIQTTSSIYPFDDASFCSNEVKLTFASAFGSSAAHSALSEYDRPVDEMDPKRASKLARRHEQIKKKHIIQKARELVQGVQGVSVTSTSSLPSRENVLQVLTAAGSSPSPTKLVPSPECIAKDFHQQNASPILEGEGCLMHFSRQNTAASPMNATTNSQCLFGIVGPLPSASSFSTGTSPSAHIALHDTNGGVSSSGIRITPLMDSSRANSLLPPTSEDSSDPPASGSNRRKIAHFDPFSASAIATQMDPLASLFQFSPATALTSSSAESGQPSPTGRESPANAPMAPIPMQGLQPATSPTTSPRLQSLAAVLTQRPQSRSAIFANLPQKRRSSVAGGLGVSTDRTPSPGASPTDVHPFATVFAVTALVEAPLYDPPATCPHLDQSAKPRGKHLDLFANELQKSVCGFEEAVKEDEGSDWKRVSASSRSGTSHTHRGYYARTPSALAAALEAQLVRIYGVATIDTTTGETIGVDVKQGGDELEESATVYVEQSEEGSPPTREPTDSSTLGMDDDLNNPLGDFPGAYGGVAETPSINSSQREICERSATHEFLIDATTPPPLMVVMDNSTCNTLQSLEVGTLPQKLPDSDDSAPFTEFQSPVRYSSLPSSLPRGFRHPLDDDSPDMTLADSKEETESLMNGSNEAGSVRQSSASANLLITPPMMEASGPMDMHLSIPLNHRRPLRTVDATLPPLRHSLRSLPTCPYVEDSAKLYLPASNTSPEFQTHSAPFGAVSSLLAQTCSASSNSTAKYMEPSCEISLISASADGLALLNPLVVRQSAKISPNQPSSASSLLPTTNNHLMSPLDDLCMTLPSTTLPPPYRSKVLFEITPNGAFGNASVSLGAASLSDMNGFMNGPHKTPKPPLH